jgi:hypothetical protein
VVLPYFEPGASALRNSLGSYASRRSLISTVWPRREAMKIEASLEIARIVTSSDLPAHHRCAPVEI